MLQLAVVNKPALLRHLFGLATAFSAQILSYNKMLGQIQDAGNTTTLAHYLRLLDSAYLVSGLESFRSKAPKRGSSPKLVLWNNALINAYGERGVEATVQDRERWGRLVENAVGAHLLNHLHPATHQLHYWREGDLEVDYVLRTPRELWALEIKSGRDHSGAGLAAFSKRRPSAKPLIIGTGGMPLTEFFETSPADLFA